MLDKQAKQQRNKEKVLAYITKQLENGVNKKEIVDDLEARGMKRNVAIDLVMDFEYKEQVEAMQAAEIEKDKSGQGLKKMGIGLAMLLGGGAVTAVTWALADPGGTYLLCYGPIIFGAIYTVWGFFEWII